MSLFSLNLYIYKKLWLYWKRLRVVEFKHLLLDNNLTMINYVYKIYIKRLGMIKLFFWVESINILYICCRLNITKSLKMQINASENKHAQKKPNK